MSNRGSQRRKRTTPRSMRVPSPSTGTRSATGLLSLEAGVGCTNAAVWVLAVLCFGYSDTISAHGQTTVRPYGLVFVVPCWLLTYANRRRVAYGLAPALVALLALILGGAEIITGWAPLPVPRLGP